MKKHLKKLFVFLPVVIFIFFLFTNIFSFSNGYVGVTNKGGEGIGCVCHGTNIPTPSVSVFFTGPDSVEVGQTVTYKITVAHGPAITGGFDAAVYAGRMDTITVEPGVRRDSATGDLTHRYPKPFTNDTVYWSFKYTAPSSVQVDTLFAVGNSTNNDTSSSGDEWNFSPNFTITVHNPIGISNSNTIVHDFKLYQNYPNPFNPVTKISYSIPSSGNVELEAYNITGQKVRSIFKGNQKSGDYYFEFNGSDLASGIYFYLVRFTPDNNASDRLIEARKMILIK
jgi:hypothetical protein